MAEAATRGTVRPPSGVQTEACPRHEEDKQDTRFDEDVGKIEPPTAVQLYKKIPQTLLLCYKAVATFSYACFFLVKNGFLTWDDGTEMEGAIACLSKKYSEMVKGVRELTSYDFRWLRNERLDYADQKEISMERVRAMTACCIHYNMDIGLVARYLDGEYTKNSWHDPARILSVAAKHVSDEILQAMRRILTTGCPSYLNWEEPAENKAAFLERGNNPTIDQYHEETWTTLNKEERNNHIVPFLAWVVDFSSSGRVTPQHMQLKGDKKRLIWNGKLKRFGYEYTMNEVTDTTDETDITFGYVYIQFATWIYNLRASYPDEDILLAFVDISSCFRFSRIFVDLWGAFGFLIGPIFFASNAMVFGSVAAASSWEPFRVAIAAIATSLFFQEELVQTHEALLRMIKWSDVAPSDTQYVPARKCSKIRGVFDDDGKRLPSPHHIYVDDNLMADTRGWIPHTLAAAAEAVYKIMGRPCLRLRPCAIAIDKWQELVISHRQVLLGIMWDTREMTVSTTAKYRQEVLDLVKTRWSWRTVGQTFNVSEMEKLVGKLGRIAQTYRPLYHMMPHLYSSIAYALRENKSFLMASSRRFRKMIKAAKARSTNEPEIDTREINFARRLVARETHRCDETYTIPPSLKQEITFIERLLSDDSIELSTAIGHIVDRDHDWVQWADSCKSSGGGWSEDLQYYWFLEYPDEVQRRARLESSKQKGYISINTLEMVCVIINLAATIYTCWHDKLDLAHHPVVLNWCDNTSATCWINRRCKESLIGRALGRLFCGMLMSTKIGIQARWLSSETNGVADDISRLKKESDDGEYDFTRLLSDHPSLLSCRRFQPSNYLLGIIWGILLNNDLPDPLMLKKLKPEELGSFISSDS